MRRLGILAGELSRPGAARAAHVRTAEFRIVRFGFFKVALLGMGAPLPFVPPRGSRRALRSGVGECFRAMLRSLGALKRCRGIGVFRVITLKPKPLKQV